jgi:predicted permease
MLRDLRHAIRLLMQSKGWTFVVLLSLALGIGANTTIFSAVNGLVLRSLAVDRPHTLVRFQWVGDNDMVTDINDYGYSEKLDGRSVSPSFSYPMFQRFREANQTLLDLVACAPQGQANVIANGQAELASRFIASGNYFQMLGVSPLIGRTLTPDDDRPDGEPVAVISHGYWQRRFGGDASALGTVVRINNVPATIVGVTPPGFTGVQAVLNDGADITVPLAMDPRFGNDYQDYYSSPRLRQPTVWWLQIMGRLKPGTTADQVRGNLEGIFQAAARDGWTSYFASLPERQQSMTQNQNRTKVPQLRVTSGSRGIYDVSADAYRSMTLVGVVVALVLLIVCANVANLLLSRAATRHKEISIRLSMGATRMRLIRQLLVESVLLALVGGAAGMLIAYWGRQLLPPNLGPATPLDWHVLVFAGGLTFATGIGFGIAPALRASGTDISAALKDTSRTASRGRTVLGMSLLVVQVAISLVLLVGAGLFLRTIQNLRHVDVGFDPQQLLLVPIRPVLNGYDQTRIATLYAQLLERLPSVAGVRTATLSTPALLSGSMNLTGIFIQGRARPERGSDRPGGRNTINHVTVAPNFFEAMGIPLVAGRRFSERDNQTAPKVVIINEAAVRKYFPGENPIGRRFGGTFERSGELEIVGIVSDVKYNSVRDAVPPTKYVPYPQTVLYQATLELRTTGDPTSVVSAVREAIRQVDPNLPILSVSTQTDQIERRFAQEKVFAQACALFGALAVLVASIGLFGLMSYNVARRTNEIGIRMALGARGRDVTRMVMGESLILVLAGIAIGGSVALAAGRFVSTLLFGVAPTDPATIALAALLMMIVSAFAAFVPARTASRVDPMIALRCE